ncbi:acyltransferase [Uliginosibacterium paludis]|uniref:Acyltransferase n=1 Tax=Uliginosibacterium paludis TaxID=1615952 RepID=A0ABV2CKE1_9RHOO
MMSTIRRLLRRLLGRDPLSRLRANGLITGRNFFMQDSCLIDASHCWHIRIGDDVTLGPRVTLLAHDASMRQALGKVRLGRLEIGSRVFIGAGAIVLPGIRIGDDCIIGAGSVVSADIPAGSLAFGNPARVMGSTADYLERQRQLMAGSPVFDERYTLRGGVTTAMKEEMNRQMQNGPAFID